MYNKIFTKILDSSIWLETNTTRIVWLTFLASMDETGYAHFAALGNLAGRARVTIEEAEAAVKVLEAPDRESSDPANDGRRIERIPGGWMVLNAEKYRTLVTRAIIQEQTRLRVQRFRDKARGNADVTQGNEKLTPSVAVSEARADNRAAVAAPASDSDFIEDLAKSPAYEGIDVRREFEKMKVWACTSKKLPSRRRFINWLNRVERPVNGHQTVQRVRGAEPVGWKAWLNHRRSDSPLAAGGEREAHDWFSIDKGSQDVILQGMREEPL